MTPPSPARPGPVLVTGAGGFLGRPTVAALARAGHPVVAALRRPLDAGWPEGVRELTGDLLDPGDRRRLLSEARAGVLVHLAWTPAAERWHGEANARWAEATRDLAADFAEAGGRRMVFGSSCAVYDWTRGPVFAEDAPLAPATAYGAAKAAAAAALAEAAPRLGLSVAEARIFFCYGPHEPPGRLLPDLVAGLAAGREVPCTDGLQRRDYLQSGDVGAALALLAGAEVEGPVNLGSGRAIEVRALIGEIARQMGRPDLPRLGAKARPPDDPEEITAGIARLSALGFRPAHDLRSGVAATLAATEAFGPG